MKKSFFLKFTIFILLISTSVNCQNSILLDSINSYYDSIINSDYNLNRRLIYAKKAKLLSDKLGVDSIKLKIQRQLAFMYYSNEVFDSYIPLNLDNLKLAQKLGDSTAIKVAASNLGSYYRVESKNDSAFYYYSKARQYYTNENSIFKVDVLLGMADIQQEEKVYEGAEEDAIAAIKVLQRIPRDENALHYYWNIYNLIATISSRTLNEEKTIEYHDKAIGITKEMKDGYGYEIYSLNNKANALRQFGRYTEALNILSNLKDDRSKYDTEEPDFYPTVLINIAKTNFESDSYEFSETEDNLKQAYQICKSIDDSKGVMASSLELCRLYLKHNKKDLARSFGKEALKISEELSNNEYKLDALLELSYLYNDGKGKDYLREHIVLQDSIEIRDRLVRNKFARVQFDTDQIEAKNEQISKENFYLLLLSVGLLLTAILVYVVISQRAKNKELQLIQDQQKANEEIYNLMLGQQDKVEEARAQEKIRVSKELHDGVLGRLFGARLSLDSLNFTEGKDAMINRANYIGQLKTIEDDIRKISHEMNTDFVAGSGFMDIVSELIENQTQAYGFTYDFDYSDDFSWEFVSNKTKINIYRIIQESLQNIYKHAKANHVKINILRVKDEINIYIVDDGKGFDVERARKGIGLKNMTSRIKDIGGKISFISKIGEGTSVKLKIPYKV